MEKKGYTQRFPIDLRALSNRAQVQKWLTEKGMTAYIYVHLKLPQFSVDILASESLKFETFDDRKVVIEAWDIKMPVISIDDLIGMKKKANREKYIQDIAALLELKSL